MENWSQLETDFREWLESYPGASVLTGRPDLEIVRRCLAVWPEDPRAITGEIQSMAKARLAPSRSWAWFPAVLARRLRRAS